MAGPAATSSGAYEPGGIANINRIWDAMASGPYNVSPAWGVATEFVLRPGQVNTQVLDNTKIWSDGSTQQLSLASGESWTHSN